MIDISEARRLAFKVIEEKSSYGHRLVLIDELTASLDEGWVFFWGDEDPMKELVGGGPIFVTRSGRVHELPSWQPWEDSVQEIVSK